MPKIFLAQEDAQTLKDFTGLILDFFPTAAIHPLTSWDELAPALAEPGPASVLLTDFWWEQEDRGDELTILSENFPRIPIAILGRYDLPGSLPAGFPIPLLVPDDQLPIRLAEFFENLEGREIGSYLLSSPAGPHPLGRLYWAKHQQLERSIQVLVPYAGSPDFLRAIQSLARLNHPAVYSLYESVAWENRMVVALEPVLQPSLLHLRLSGEPLSLRAGARMATALGSILAETSDSSVPVRCLGAYDYTVSPKGTPRLRNPAALPNQAGVSVRENAQNLAALLEPFLQEEPRASGLLEILNRTGNSADDLLPQLREFERQLAEVRAIRVRKEELEAAEKTLRARQIRRWAIAIGSVLAAGFFAVYARVLFHQFLLDVPAKLMEAELPVPEGQIVREGQSITVSGFFLDRHEVTIGEYERFLAAARENPDWLKWVPEEARAQKTTVTSLEPRDWAEMLRRARKNEKYQEQKISRDTPVFNVDFPSAMAYAHWKGRRLPTMDEWLRAAGGDPGLPYPWGTQPEPTRANLGMRRDEANTCDGGDSYFNAAPGETFSGDRGPFGHFDLGGNLSEWAVGPLQKPVALGGNFTDPEPVPLSRTRRQDANRNDPPGKTRLEIIGFRTAR